MAGDREQNQALIGQYEERRTASSPRRSGEKTARLQELRGRIRSAAGDPRPGDEKTLEDLEDSANQADKDSRAKKNELLAMEREVPYWSRRWLPPWEEEANLLDKLWETYELSHEAAKQHRVEIESVPKASRRIGELKRAISSLGP